MTPAAPCIICGKPDWCSRKDNGEVVKCRRVSAHPIYGGAFTKPDSQGPAHFYWPNGERGPRRGSTAAPPPAAQPVPTRPRAAFSPDRFAVGFTPKRSADLAAALRLPSWAVAGFPGVGFRPADHPDRDAWTFAQRDGTGRVIGFAVRHCADGRKAHVAGTHSGLFVPPGWRDGAGPILLVEGPSDTLAATAAGLSAVGRPSNLGGVDFLAELLKDAPADRPLVVVGENDRKPDDHPTAPGAWPGRHGAYTTATQLAAKLGGPVKWVQVPGGDKDTRDWLVRHTAGTGSRGAWQAAGRRFAAALLSAAIDASPGPPVIDHMDLPDESPACPTAFKALLKGKLGTKRKGQRRAADFNCRRWQCPPCKARHVNQHLSWLYRCVVQWADPLRLLPAIPRLAAADVKAGIPPGDYPPPERPAGPWELRMTLADPRRLRSLLQGFRRLNQIDRRVEYVAVKVTRLFDLAGSCYAFVIYWNTPPQLYDKCVAGGSKTKHSKTLLIAAFRPDVIPPSGLPRVSADFALMFIAEHLAIAGDGVKTRRLQPVSCSKGWKPTKEIWEQVWGMEGSRAHDVDAMRLMLEQLHAKLLEDRAAAITWADATLGPEVAQRFAELCREQHLTADEIVTLLSPPRA